MTDFVSVGWLADRLEAVHVVDVRDAWEYEGIGHLPDAVSIPFDSFRASEGDAGMLPGADVFADLLSAAGITAADDIVAYDDTHGVFAARFLVTAELYGHDPGRLHLLDGDFSAWQRERETTDESPDVTRTDYEIERPAESPLVGRETVAAAIDTDAVIVDTREREEYEEGHIPGAVQLDWRTLVDDETRGLKPREEIETLLESAGITLDSRIVLYCNTARRISHTYVVLRHLGYDDVAFYEGSLTEWAAAGEPIETGV
ncbi:Thiosulfate sulfurtransferase protein [Halorhabdus tiamatea SARL4B]|uniref:Rhodanese domain protein n=1 Tax=Halorhabdus tiamatea SARL4B TaxID=1033806 RepID=F7PKK3_9EURY|nr:sulfurtransferase [Halorhabdus tiamatea]ERJ05980.1 Thiosulfate sulfurtransferase protein [Halorhabdus tiamatea SARL4B]CCQ33988.1 rhodanese domain protein [Halorhabdus tiamatea SARL4B]